MPARSASDLIGLSAGTITSVDVARCATQKSTILARAWVTTVAPASMSMVPFWSSGNRVWLVTGVRFSAMVVPSSLLTSAWMARAIPVAKP